jgi:O-methyltransferase involved in polyketide biosynthesis
VNGTTRQPSQTALAAARAAHLVVDQQPLIFRDPVAADLIGEVGAEMVGYHRRSGDHIVLAGTRAQVSGRRRYTEQRLAELAIPAALWRRTDVLRPADLCRLARAAVSP